MAFQTTNLNNCFICGQQVMELHGESQYFDTFGLDESEKAFKENAFGKCHSKCLVESEWGIFWQGKMAHRYGKNLMYQSIRIDSSAQLLVRDQTEEVVILFDNGVHFPFFLRELDKATASKSQLILRHSTEFNLEFNNSEFVIGLRKELESQKRFNFHLLLKELGLLDKFLHPDLMNEASLIFEKKLKREWRHNWISCRLEYPVPIPEKIRSIVDTLQ